MNLNQQEQMERRAWLFSALTTTLMVAALLALALSSCKRKPTAAPSIPFDSTRHQLELQVEGSRNQVNVSQGKAQQTVTPYETADSTFASIPLSLP